MLEIRKEDGIVKNTRKIAFVGMFVALEIALTRVSGIMVTSITRISLSFIAYGIAGLIFGPGFTTIVGIVGDLIGATILPQGTFFPGFTISAGITGFLIGFIKKYNSPLEILGILVINTLLVDTLMNTTWLVMMGKSLFIPVLLQRLPGILINFALRILVLIPLIQKLKKMELFNEN